MIANRNSLLDQIAALNVPDDPRAQRSADLLQRAAAASFAADVGYRRALLDARRCPAKLDRVATARADKLKGQFVLENGRGVRALVSFPRWPAQTPTDTQRPVEAGAW